MDLSIMLWKYQSGQDERTFITLGLTETVTFWPILNPAR